MNKISQINLVILASFLSGCALFSPDYQQPSIATPTTTRSGIIIESNNQNLTNLYWWKKLDDPILNQLITQALQQNNQIQMAQGNILQAQAQLKAAEYSWIPTLGAGGGGLTGNTWAGNITPQGALIGNTAIQSGSMANSNFSGYYGGFVPSYNFNVFQNMSQTKLAQASLEMQKAAMSATRLSLISQVTGAYFMLLGQKNQLILQQQLVNDLIELRKLQMIQYQTGATDLSTVAVIEQQIASSQAQLPTIENSLAKTENALQLLLNKNPGPIITQRNINQINLIGIIPENIPSTVLKNRPDIILAEDNLKIANANIGLANSLFFPTISLTGLIGGSSLALSNLFTLGTGFWMMQAAATMPILNASSFEQVKTAKGGYYVAYYNYMQTVKTAFMDVDNSLTNYQKVSQMYQATAKSNQVEQQVYQISQTKYVAGAGDMRALLGVKLDVDSSNLSLNQAKMQQLDSIVQVYQALAGGYLAESKE